MALKPEKPCSDDRKGLLDMQAAYERDEQHDEEQDIEVRPFVPIFLTV